MLNATLSYSKLKSFSCKGKSQQQNLTSLVQVVYKNVATVAFHGFNDKIQHFSKPNKSLRSTVVKVKKQLSEDFYYYLSCWLVLQHFSKPL